MKKTISKYDFRQAFTDAGRGEQFSYEALGLLFDYFEQLEQDFGEEIELDVIAICCEYAEGTAEEIAESYDIDLDECDDDEKKDAVREYLNNETMIVGETSDGFIYAQF